MFKLLNYLSGYFYLFRPYSWINLLLLATIAIQFAVSELFAIGLVLALILWFLLILILEYVHKDEGRPNIHIILPIALLATAGFLVFNNLSALTALFSLTIVSFLYALKKKAYFGLISFIVRGLQQVLLFLTIFFFAGGITESIPILFVIFVFSFAAARNLIAVFRDVVVDKVTFPIITGMPFSKIVAGILLMFSSYLSFALLPHLALLVPIILLFLLLILYNPVKLHRSAIILTTAYFSTYLALLTNNPWWLVLIGADALSSMLFYKKISRPANIQL